MPPDSQFTIHDSQFTTESSFLISRFLEHAHYCQAQGQGQGQKSNVKRQK